MTVHRVLIDDCLGCPSKKISYESRRAALKVLKTLRNGAGGNRTFHCRHCDLWHIGRSYHKAPGA